MTFALDDLHLSQNSHPKNKLVKGEPFSFCSYATVRCKHTCMMPRGIARFVKSHKCLTQFDDVAVRYRLCGLTGKNEFEWRRTRRTKATTIRTTTDQHSPSHCNYDSGESPICEPVSFDKTDSQFTEFRCGRVCSAETALSLHCNVTFGRQQTKYRQRKQISAHNWREVRVFRQIRVFTLNAALPVCHYPSSQVPCLWPSILCLASLSRKPRL